MVSSDAGTIVKAPIFFSFRYQLLLEADCQYVNAQLFLPIIINLPRTYDVVVSHKDQAIVLFLFIPLGTALGAELVSWPHLQLKS